MCPRVTWTLSVIKESQIMGECVGCLKTGQSIYSGIQSPELLLEFPFLTLKLRKTEN